MDVVFALVYKYFIHPIVNEILCRQVAWTHYFLCLGADIADEGCNLRIELMSQNSSIRTKFLKKGSIMDRSDTKIGVNNQVFEKCGFLQLQVGWL